MVSVHDPDPIQGDQSSAKQDFVSKMFLSEASSSASRVIHFQALCSTKFILCGNYFVLDFFFGSIELSVRNNPSYFPTLVIFDRSIMTSSLECRSPSFPPPPPSYQSVIE